MKSTQLTPLRTPVFLTSWLHWMLYASNVRHLCNTFWTWTKFKIKASDLFGLHVHNIRMCSTFLSEVHGLPGDFCFKISFTC